MNFNAKELASALGPLMKAQSKTNIIEAYNDILFEGDADALRVTAASESVRVTVALPALKHGIPEHPFRVKAKPLAGALEGLPDTPVTIEADENFSVTLKHGSGRLTIQGGDGTEFPAPDNEEGHEDITLPAGALRTAIGRVAYAIPKGKDASLRPVLQGMALSRDAERLEAVATDSTLLAVTDVAAGGPRFLEVIPVGTLAVLPPYLSGTEDIRLSIGVRVSRIFTADGTTIEWRRNNRPYPNYKSVMPNGGEALEVDRTSLLGTLRRVALGAPESGLVMLSVAGCPENSLVVRGENFVKSISVEETSACSWGGDAIEIGFNCSKLEAAVEHLTGDSVRIAITGPNRPALVTGDDGTRVALMPISL